MTDADDDLRTRLDRLAPSIPDVEAALAGVRVSGQRRQNRQRQLVGLAVAVVLVVLVSGMALARNDGGGSEVVASDPSVSQDDPSGRDSSSRHAPGTTTTPGTTLLDPSPTSIDPSPPVDPAGLAGAPSPTRTSTTGGPPPAGNGPSVDDSEALPRDEMVPPDPEPGVGPPPVEVVITPTAPLTIGERLTFRVDITNRGSEPVWVNAGECGSVEVFGANGGGQSPAVPGWRPASIDLVGYAASHDLAVRGYPTEPAVGMLQDNCSPTNFFPTLGYTIELQPGGVTSHLYVWDATVLPPVSGAVDSIEIRARVRFPASVDPYDESSRPPEYTSASVPVADVAGAHASPAAFLAAVDANAVVDAWLIDHPAAPSGYRVVLSFLRGSFELWIDDGTTKVRIRGSVLTGAIQDIRSLRSRCSPSDDPTALNKDPNEVVLFVA